MFGTNYGYIPNMQAYQNPYAQNITPGMQMNMQGNPTNSGLIRVTGIDGAKAYQMQPNSVVALFDANEDIMYIKSADGAGFPTIRTFKFIPYEETQQTMTAGDFISREEFESFKKEVQGYAEQFVSATDKRSKSTKSD